VRYARSFTTTFDGFLAPFADRRHLGDDCRFRFIDIPGRDLSGLVRRGDRDRRFSGSFGQFFSRPALELCREGRCNSGQALRYAAVSAGSLTLNSAGVYLLTEDFGIYYALSKLITAILVGLLFNFPLHRRFVFRRHTYAQ
jgi:hypothetical protein